MKLNEQALMAVITILNGEAYQQARQIQRWMQEEHEISQPPLYQPHLTFAIGEKCGGRQALIQQLSALAGEIDPFEIAMTGLGIFSPKPTLYLPVPRGPDLASLHERISQLFSEIGCGNKLYYQPQYWMPHITLASRDLTPERLGAIVPEMLSHTLPTTSRLACLVLVEEVEEDHWAICYEFPLRGENELDPNPHGLSSRPCQPSDRLFVYQIVEETLKPYISVFFTWDQARFEQNWEASWRDKRIILAEGRPVGYYQVDTSPPEHIYIGNLFLTPAVHGRGWGGWLLRQLEGMAAGRPIRLHVWENNPAVAFYHHHGYRIIETVGYKHLMEKT
jgi:2'-5' RNA ligase/ribosomal protein S18 acetylase RimI-like enzyme